MSRVSVSANQKPKPKATFKFLRRDEGRLSYSATPETPRAEDAPVTPSANRERRDSRALREAIAVDMRNIKAHDPLSEVVIAVPKRGPPVSTPTTPAAIHHQPQQQQQQQPLPERGGGAPPPVRSKTPARPQTAKRPEWVDPEMPPPQRRTSMAREDTRGDHVEAQQHPHYSSSNLANGQANRSSEDYERPRYEGGTPRRTTPAGPGANNFSPLSQPHQQQQQRKYMDAAYEDTAHHSYEQNYFRRPAPAVSAGGMRNREEEGLMIQLEQEVRAAQEERARYTEMRQQMDREKHRFESYRFGVQQQLDDERADLDAARASGAREAQKGLKSMEERYKSVSALLSTEREANRKLMQENESLRAQLEELTETMRESHRTNKAEVGRLRRDIESLSHRNSELLSMAKGNQLLALDYQHDLQQQRSGSEHGSAARFAPSGETSQQAFGHPSAPLRQRAGSRTSVSSLQPSEHAEGPVGEEPARHAGAPPPSRSVTQPPPLDFSPRVTDTEARERRAREVEERMRREEAEMQQRRQQREKEAAKRRDKEAAEAAARADEERRRREEDEQRREDEAARRKEAFAARKRKEAEEQAAAVQKEQHVLAAPAVSGDIANERRSAGHPPRTPRMQSGTDVKKRNAAAPSQTTAASSKHIPTREQLIGDVEEAPSENFPNDAVVSQTALGDNPNKRELLYRSGKREIHYANGTVKLVLPSGHTILHFTNKDTKCTFPSGKSTYWYDAAQTVHVQQPDGVQIFEFRSTGQTERHTPDGCKEILYPDGIYKLVRADGTDETQFPEE